MRQGRTYQARLQGTAIGGDEMVILKKIYRELAGIRRELHAIRNLMEPCPVDVDVDHIMSEMADKLKPSFQNIHY